MNPRNTGLLFLVTLALAAFLYFYVIGGEEERKEAEEASRRVFSGLEAEDVTRIELTAGGETPAVVERTSEGWRVREPVDFPGDEATLDGLASTLAGLTSEAVIEEPQEPAVYGLAEDAHVVRFEARSEAPGRADAEEETAAYELRAGSKTPVGANTYVSREDDERVFMVPSWRINSLRKEVVDLRDRRVLDFDRSTIDRIDARWPGGAVSLEKRDGTWWLTAPIDDKADDEVVDDLLSDLAFLRADGFEDDPPPDEESGLDDPEFAAVLHGGGDGETGTELRFAVGSLVEGGDRLARGRHASLYRVAGERLSDLPRELVAYRFKKVASFEPSDARRFELSFLDGDSRTVVEGALEDSGWTTTPESMDPDRAADLIAELSRLKGVDILADGASDQDLADHGLSPPRVEIRVLSEVEVEVEGEGEGEGELLAHVALGEADADGIAVRAVGGAQILRLDGDLAEQIPVSLEAFRNRFLADEEDGAAAEVGEEAGAGGGDDAPLMSVDPPS